MRWRATGAPLGIATFAAALIGPLAAAAEEQPAPPPPPGQWVLVLPAGSIVTVPGAEVRLPASRPRPRYYSPEDPARLRRAMEFEGPDYSFEQLRAYKRRMLAGGVIGALGGVVAYFSLCVIAPAGLETAGIIAASGGFAALAIGLPLFVSGSLGRERQLLLWRKDEITSGPHWTAGISAGPGGAALGASIVF